MGTSTGVELATDMSAPDERSAGSGGTDAVSRRYAAALFELATDGGELARVEEDARRLREALAASPDLRNLIGNPLFSRDDTARALDAVATHLQLSSLTHKFLGVLSANRRLPALASTLRAFADMAAAHRGEVTAEVTTARPLSPDQMQTLKRALRERAGREVTVETTTDPNILGGLIVRLGSQLIDSSIRTKLNTLAQAMKG